MLQPSGFQMDHLPFSFLKHPLIATTLSLILLLGFCCCYCYFSSAFLTVLVLVLPASFPFIFSKTKQLCKAGMAKKPQEVEVDAKTLPEDQVAEENATVVEKEAFQMNGLACDSPEMDRSLLKSSKSLAEEVGRIPLQCSDSSVSDDDQSPPGPGNGSQLSGCSEGSISDDDSLIEIALPDGHYLEPEEPNRLFSQSFKGAFLPAEFLPDSVFRKHGLKELLSEINEEDNLIEIDIAMGSIKCSEMGIKA